MKVFVDCDCELLDSGLKSFLSQILSKKEEADFIVYNTCTVRENANLKLYGHLGHLKKAKQKSHLTRGGFLLLLSVDRQIERGSVFAERELGFSEDHAVFGNKFAYITAEFANLLNHAR